MNVIWKYPLKTHNEILDLPAGAQILTIQEQQGCVQLWALVDPHAPTVARRIFAITTGGPYLSFANKQYITTVQLHGGAFVLHFFEAVDS